MGEPLVEPLFGGEANGVEAGEPEVEVVAGVEREEFDAVGGGGGQAFGVGEGEHLIMAAVDEEDVGLGAGDGIDGADGVGVKIGGLAGDRDGLLDVVIGEKNMPEAQDGGSGIVGGGAEGVEGFEEDHGGEAGVDGGPLEGDGGAVGSGEDADVSGNEVFAFEGVEELDEVMGFDGAVGDKFAGGATLAAEIDLDDAVAEVGGGFAIEDVGGEGLVVGNAGEEDEGAAGWAAGPLGACGGGGGWHGRGAGRAVDGGEEAAIDGVECDVFGGGGGFGDPDAEGGVWRADGDAELAVDAEAAEFFGGGVAAEGGGGVVVGGADQFEGDEARAAGEGQKEGDEEDESHGFLYVERV